MIFQNGIRKYLSGVTSFVAALAVIVLGVISCEKEQTGPGGLARLELNRYSVQFETHEKSSVDFSLLSTRDWTASCTASWVALTQTEGAASKEKVQLTVYVTRNDGLERVAEIIFVNGRFTKIFRIVQPGLRAIEYTPISQVRSYCEAADALPSGTVIKGTVVSDRVLNNLPSYKIAYIQDETAGLKFYFSDKHMLNQGDEVTVDVSGCRVSRYEGSVQIEGLPDSYAKVVARGKEVLPKAVAVDDLLDNKCDGQYVSVENVTVADGYQNATWASSGSHTEIPIDAGDGRVFYVMTSKHAQDLYGAQVPQGTGTLSGIASIVEKSGESHIRMFFAKMTDYSGMK